MIEKKQSLSENEKEQLYKIYNDEITLINIFSVLWNQRWFIIGFTLVIMVFGSIYGFIKTPLYEITARISPGITGFPGD